MVLKFENPNLHRTFCIENKSVCLSIHVVLFFTFELLFDFSICILKLNYISVHLRYTSREISRCFGNLCILKLNYISVHLKYTSRGNFTWLSGKIKTKKNLRK